MAGTELDHFEEAAEAESGAMIDLRLYKRMAHPGTSWNESVFLSTPTLPLSLLLSVFIKFLMNLAYCIIPIQDCLDHWLM